MDRVLPENARIGCRNCDWVGGLSSDYPVAASIYERQLHGYHCPTCGENDLHEYPVPGSWPSDYPEGCPLQDFPQDFARFPSA